MECSHVFLYPYGVGCLNSCFLEPKAYLSISTVNNEQPSGSIHFEKVRLCAALWRPPWGVQKNNTCVICYPLISTSEVSYSYSNTSSVSGSRWILLSDGDMTNGELVFDCYLVAIRVVSFASLENSSTMTIPSRASFQQHSVHQLSHSKHNFYCSQSISTIVLV